MSIPPFSDLTSLWQELLTKRKKRLGSIKSFFILVDLKKAAAYLIGLTAKKLMIGCKYYLSFNTLFFHIIFIVLIVIL